MDTSRDGVIPLVSIQVNWLAITVRESTKKVGSLPTAVGREPF